jgi:hypothetical protein
MRLVYQRPCTLVSSVVPKLKLSIRCNFLSALACQRHPERLVQLQPSMKDSSFPPKLYLMSQSFAFPGRHVLHNPNSRRLSGLDGDHMDKTNGEDSSVMKPTRRRRSGSHIGRIAEEDRYDDEKSAIPDISPKLFAYCSTFLLNKIYERCLPLVKINDNMKLVKGDSCIDEDAKARGIEVNDELMDGPYLIVDLGPVEGQYVLLVNTERHLVLFQSPISGHLLYEYHLPTETWINVQDGHNLEGIFVRDLCRKIKGYPNL